MLEAAINTKSAPFGKGYMMRQMSVAALLIILVSLFFSNATRAGEPVAITRLVMRDRIVIITSSSAGLQYSLLTQDGTVIAANLSEDQLAQKHPDVYEQFRPAIADPASPGVTIWAGM